VKAWILNIGNELIQGQVVNGNGAAIAAVLREWGWDVQEIRCIRDGEIPLRQALTQCPKDIDLIVATGGLGPTPDDTTRFDIAKILGLDLDYHSKLSEHMKDWFTQRGRPYRESNEIQAYLPKGATILQNPTGTAVGFLIESDSRKLAFMPGVPSEMLPMLKNELRQNLPNLAAHWYRRELVTWGLGEDLQTQLLAEVEFLEPLLFASLPSTEGLLLRISAFGSDFESIQSCVDHKFEEVLMALKPYHSTIVSMDGKKLPEAVIDYLIRSKETVSVAESCTGGILGGLLTRMPGSSQAFWGGIISYDNSVKINRLGVPEPLLQMEGAVSEACARAMAQGVRLQMGTTWGLAVTGIAGPDGGSPEKPVGTVWLALAGPQGVKSEKVQLRGYRDQIRLRAASSALDLLRREFDVFALSSVH
jgi:nicotinamide-nucleotide amidase